MTARTSKVDRPTSQPAGTDEGARAARLVAANINPRTGLATDYLNHFNEAIMLLEMIPDMPECAEDFLNWRPLSYSEHFTASSFSARDLAIEAYETTDAEIRAEVWKLGVRHHGQALDGALTELRDTSIPPARTALLNHAHPDAWYNDGYKPRTGLSDARVRPPAS